MLRHFNLLLRRLFEKDKSLGLHTGQIGFEPPDENWRKYVGTLQQRAINIYLADLRENHGMRANEGWRTVRNGIVRQAPAPRWLDCHYLITAWDPMAPDIAHGVEPSLAEHDLLSAVVCLLADLETAPLTPLQVYEPDPLPDDFPQMLADAGLPPLRLPGEGFPKLAEFWGAMGAGSRWKPAVYLVATLPLIRPEVSAGTPVTTMSTGFGQKPAAQTEGQLQISGKVLDTRRPLAGQVPAPVSGARVRLETPDGILLRETLSDEAGGFIFSGLSAGQYQLRAVAAAIGEKTCPIEVRAAFDESGSDNYDVIF